MARNIGALAGLPDTVPAVTVNRYCSSGLQTIAYGAEKIMIGHADTVLAGGAESMSMVPMMGHVVRPNAKLAETAPEYYMGMGHTAEEVAKNTESHERIRMLLLYAVIKELPRQFKKGNLLTKLSRSKS